MTARVTIKDVLSPVKEDFSFKELETEFMKVSSKLTYESSPFYASVLMQCARIYTFKLPTLAVAVTQQVLLLVNPDFFMGRLKVKDKKTGKEILVGCKDIQERMAVLEHELLHLVFYHVSRGHRHNDRERSNIAADLVVNQYVRSKLPGDCITLKGYDMPPEKDLDFYYNELKKKETKGKDKGKGKLLVPGGKKGEKGQGEEGGEGDGEGDGEGEGYATGENGRGSHDVWGEKDDVPGDKKNEDILKDVGIEGGGLSEGAREAIVTDMVRQAAAKDGKEGMSKLPGTVAGQIEEMIKPKQATQPWNQILRRFTGTHGSSILKSARKYQSRRYRDPRTGMKLRPGLRIKRQKKIMVGIDTSGSMSINDLNLLAGELALIGRYNHDITIVECDTDIHRVYKFRGELKSVCGRGGTDMWPIRRMFEQGDYDCLILMTDGHVGDIGDRGPRKGWLWVITHGGNEPAKWGSYIFLPDASTVADA